MNIKIYDRIVLKRIARRSLKSKRLTNTLIIISITFSIALITILILSSLGTKTRIQRKVQNLYQANVCNVTEDAVFKARETDIAKKIGAYNYVGPINIQNEIFYIDYYDETVVDYGTRGALNGDYCRGNNEIIISREVLNLVDPQAAIGDTVAIDLGLGTSDYVVSGILEVAKDTSASKMIFISRDILGKLIPEHSSSFNMFIWNKDVFSKSERVIKNEIIEIVSDSGIDPENVYYNNTFFTNAGYNVSFSDIFLMLIIALVVLLAGVIVIYSIFYISISSKVREYGQLRTIGMTTKQMKTVIMMEGRYLMFTGIGLGIVFGSIVSYCLNPLGWNIKNTMIGILIVIVFGYVVIDLSISKPASIATKITPVEALRYSEYQGSNNARFGKRRKRFTITHLAFCNLMRTPRKTILCIISFVLCGVLFLTVASIQKSFTLKDTVRQNEYIYGDYKISFEGNRDNNKKLGGNAIDYGYAVSQQIDNSMDQEFLESMKELNQVKDYKLYKGTTVLYSVEGTRAEDDQMFLWAYDKDMQKRLESCLVEGSVDYDELVENNGIIINGKDTMQKLYGWNVKLGDKITVSYWIGDGKTTKETYTVMGITQGHDGYSQCLRIPEELLSKAVSYNCSKSVEIITEKGDNDTLTKSLEQLIQNKDMELESFQDSLDETDSAFNSAFMLMYVLAIFLSVYAIISLLNMTITNFTIRKRELGILQAVGLTTLQLRKSLLMEELLFCITTIVISTVLSIPLGIIGCNALEAMNVVIHYKFPVVSFVLYSILVLAIVFIIVNVISNQMNKVSLVERMKNE
jgi:putative ABC transport system permease protein